ncbi:MAG: hypothetical protein SVY10_02355 [Thermodesulfobacteriota bacterium]|nr:hypothetical protein [Thermodesulfobacteriota bacterium]
MTVLPSIALFYMAAAPFQIEVTSTTARSTFRFHGFQGNVDLISLHTDNFFGLPWDEFKPGGERVNAWHDVIEGIKAEVEPLQAGIYLSVTPLNGFRTTIAVQAREVDDELYIDDEWLTGCYNFDTGPSAVEIRTAYLNYVHWMVDFFGPVFLTHGIEINMYMDACPDSYESLIRLLNDVYDQEKARNTDLIIFPTFTASDMWDYGEDGNCPVGDRSCLTANLENQRDIKRDRFGISAYPFLLEWEWDHIPNDYFSAFAELTEETIVFSETGQGSYNVTIPWPEPTDPCFTVLHSSDEAQMEYMQFVFEEADRHKSDLVVWWSLRDFLFEEILTNCPCQAPGLWCLLYDAVTEDGLLPAWIMWGSMGVFDYNGALKESHPLWSTWLQKERKN